MQAPFWHLICIIFPCHDADCPLFWCSLGKFVLNLEKKKKLMQNQHLLMVLFAKLKKRTIFSTILAVFNAKKGADLIHIFNWVIIDKSVNQSS